MRRATAHLPLHTGSAPPWLFQRMWRLAGAITQSVVDEYGSREMLRRLADPWWFQAFGCVLGFDWHSSGVTTVTCGALKQAYKHFKDDLGIHVAGGKGATSRQTPSEIDRTANRLALSGGVGEKLIHASRMSAKVDSAAVQDGYQLYHHAFFFDAAGQWAVVQQGMNDGSRYARRYHWLAESTDDFVVEPHHAIDDRFSSPATHASVGATPASPASPGRSILNMVAIEADANRAASTQLVGEWHPDKLLAEAGKLAAGPTLFAPAHHEVELTDVNLPRLEKILRHAHEQHPQDFAALLAQPHIGPATVRALSLLAELIYNAPASHRDPAHAHRDPATPQKLPPVLEDRKWADYFYAHGGKDGHPHPVDRSTYDHSIHVLTEAVNKARVGQTDKREALKRLAKISIPAR